MANEKNLRVPVNEVIDHIPSCPFNIQQMGWLVSLNLVVGRKRKDYTEISITSLKSLIDYRKIVVNEIIK